MLLRGSHWAPGCFNRCAELLVYDAPQVFRYDSDFGGLGDRSRETSVKSAKQKRHPRVEHSIIVADKKEKLQ